MARIATLDLPQVNKELSRIDELERRLAQLERHKGKVDTQLGQLQSHAIPTSNNLTFTWTGGSTALSWSAGSVKDKTGINIPVKAGSLTLSASTYYWLAWNRVHQQMIAKTDVEVLLQNKNNTVICQVFTGTGAQTGTAGGGGSTSGKDLSGARYKNF